MLNIKEIYQETVRAESSHHRMTLKKVYAIRDCLINPDYVVAAYPYKESRSMAYGEYLLGQDPMSNEENYSIRNFENIPDTVFYPSPSSIENGVISSVASHRVTSSIRLSKESLLAIVTLIDRI